MRFLKRGRPKTNRPKVDFGTKELQEKRRQHLTDEPIDLCLKRNLINMEQHWAAIHFRWLHTLRYGVTSVRSIDTQNIGGVERRSENLVWAKKKQEEYSAALNNLESNHCAEVLIKIVTHNEWPKFLRWHDKKFFTLEDHREHKRLIKALNVLENDFGGKTIYHPDQTNDFNKYYCAEK